MKHLSFLLIIQFLLLPCNANSLQVGAERLDVLLPLLQFRALLKFFIVAM